jgi:hypothetical protein
VHGLLLTADTIERGFTFQRGPSPGAPHRLRNGARTWRLRAGRPLWPAEARPILCAIWGMKAGAQQDAEQRVFM